MKVAPYLLGNLSLTISENSGGGGVATFLAPAV